MLSIDNRAYIVVEGIIGEPPNLSNPTKNEQKSIV